MDPEPPVPSARGRDDPRVLAYVWRAMERAGVDRPFPRDSVPYEQQQLDGLDDTGREIDEVLVQLAIGCDYAARCHSNDVEIDYRAVLRVLMQFACERQREYDGISWWVRAAMGAAVILMEGDFRWPPHELLEDHLRCSPYQGPHTPLGLREDEAHLRRELRRPTLTRRRRMVLNDALCTITGSYRRGAVLRRRPGADTRTRARPRERRVARARVGSRRAAGIRSGNDPGEGSSEPPGQRRAAFNAAAVR